MKRTRWIALLSLAFTSPAFAETLQFTSSVIRNYELKLLGGTPLNPGPDTPFLPFRFRGVMTFELDPSLNDPLMPTTVPFVKATGVLDAVPPSLDFTLPHTVSPNVEFIGGSLTNIVRDASGEVVSADISNLSMRWELVSSNPMFPVRLYTKVGLPFDAKNVSIPFANGTVLVGPELFDAFLDDGDGDFSNDLLVALGQNRTIDVVPEPSSAVLLATSVAMAMGVSAFRHLRRRQRGGSTHSKPLGCTPRDAG